MGAAKSKTVENKGAKRCDALSLGDATSKRRTNMYFIADDQTGSDGDNSIEAYILPEADFSAWRTGNATGSLYESGNVAQGTVHADVPPGAGIYYLVFSNKSAPKNPKSIHATVLLRYKSWLPDSLRRMKARFWDWVGAT